jgi:hypothetical protein
MIKKSYIIIAVIAIIIITGVAFNNLNKKSTISLTEKNNPPKENTTTEQVVGKTGNFENSQLLEIARQYVIKKPKIYWLSGKKFVSWNDYKELGTSFSKANPEWIISHKASIQYIEPNKYKPPYDNLNDKYMISWFFIPGCEENPNRSDRPNWFDKNGLNCMGGYNMNVLLNSDGTPKEIDMDAVD